MSPTGVGREGQAQHPAEPDRHGKDALGSLQTPTCTAQAALRSRGGGLIALAWISSMV